MWSKGKSSQKNENAGNQGKEEWKSDPEELWPGEAVGSV